MKVRVFFFFGSGPSLADSSSWPFSTSPSTFLACFLSIAILFCSRAFTAESGVNGTMCFEGVKYQLTVLNLPAVTECYKSYDDVNLVKSGDVGQILIVGDLIDDEASTGETKDGITPPMRNARQRVFREPISVSKETVKKVEEQLFAILDVCWFIDRFISDLLPV